MCDRPRRNISRIDYAALNREGVIAAVVTPDEDRSSDNTSVSEDFETAISGSEASVASFTFVADCIDTMDDARVRQLTTELETIFFQINEITETAEEELLSMSLKDIAQQYEELKVLRVNMIKFQQEFRLIDEDNKYHNQVKMISTSNKDTLKSSRKRMSDLEGAKQKSELDHANSLKAAEQQKLQARQHAFLRSVNEIEAMYVKLNTAYAPPAHALDRATMLKRNEEKPALAREFDRFRERVDNLIQTDVALHNREAKLDEVINMCHILATNKELYETRVYNDLVANDLTEEKRKLAEQNQIDIGKFSGAPGEDFYSFKSLFLKTYAHHPKSSMVNLLKNNHLKGSAKDSVGSLEDIDNIWKRLKDNFGNTEQMLLHHFGKMNKLGPMHKQKSYTNKKHYIQSLVNAMQDAIDVAVEHGLEGEVHYGPQLRKIVTLLDNNLQNGWYKLITEEATAMPQRWTRMIIYLEAQLSIIQTRAFETESAELRSTQDKKDSSRDTQSLPQQKRDNKTGPLVNVASDVCGLCDEKHPSANIGFLNCKKFLVMSQKERCNLVRKKQKCLQCLNANVNWKDPNHTCSNEWICQSEAHEKFTKKLHILLCEFHTSDDRNKALFEKLKKEVLKAEWQKKVVSGFISRVNAFQSRIKPPLHDDNVTSVVNPSENEKYNSVSVPKCIQLPDAASANSESLELVEFNGDQLPDASENGVPVFLLQPVLMFGHIFNIMYDGGCLSVVSRKAAVDRIPDQHKNNVIPGPLYIKGVGDTLVTSPYGHYSFELPIHDGRLATFSGMCLDVVTGGMPPYPVREASKVLSDAYVAKGGKISDLPQVPLLVGGETDILLGIQYNWYQPRLLFILPTGLAIYKSVFKGVDGSRGCIGGSHKLFTQCERQFLESHNHTISEFRAFLAQQIQMFNNGYKVCLDHDSLSWKNSMVPHRIAFVDGESECEHPRVMFSSNTVLLNDADEAGNSIEYRCVKCRGCKDCKRGETLEKVSLREEFEQHVIDSSVCVNFDKKETVAVLPFIADPAEKLASNEENAVKIYNQQVRKLAKLPSGVKEAVLESEKKLQDLNHVDWVENLLPDQCEILECQVARYFMPWRVVHNENSTTTPTRIVFDASSVTKTGYSLNDILAKGINSLNSLLEIFLRWRCVTVAMHTDIKKMYNVVKLKPEHWTYQRYLWHPTLDPSASPSEKVIKTLIYGIKPSGNQATVGLRITAERQRNEYPAAAEAIVRDTYVDDCATGITETVVKDCIERGIDPAEKLSMEIDHVIGKGGFITKGYSVSGRPPLSELSKDGVKVSVLGIEWVPEPDLLQLAVGPLNFAKKYRGKRQVTEDSRKIPDKITKRICTGKSGEVFDVSGLVAPLVATFKLDIRDLIIAGLGWDDEIPDNFREAWVKDFQMMESIGDLVYKRAVVPPNAVSTSIELIGTGDASERMVCAGCYIRFQLSDSSHSCQLILGKTKIVPEGMTLPRAEMMAAILNVHVMEIVKRALQRNCSDYILVSDSEIALFWLTSQTKRQKPWVRNRAIEANRFSNPHDWYHINSDMNPADIGTRRGATLKDVNCDSEWIKGKPWMSLPLVDLRSSYLKSVDSIKYRQEQIDEIKRELMGPAEDLCDSQFHLLTRNSCSFAQSKCFLAGGSRCYTSESDISTKVRERLLLSKYLIDPNKFKFMKVIRVMALVIKAVKLFLSFKEKKLSLYSYAIDPLSDIVAVNRTVLEDISCLKVVNPFSYKSGNVCVVLTDEEIQYAMDYFFKKATQEVKHFVNRKVYENISVERNGILFYTGRVLSENITFRCTLTDVMLDLSSGSFIVPLVDRHSPVAYSLVDQVHWYHRTSKHSGVETTIRCTMNIAHIFGIRELVKLFEKQCLRCRYLLKRTIDVEMAPASKHQLCVAPPFYVTQLDLCGNFNAYLSKLKTVKIWIVTFVCSTTGTTNLKVMEGYNATQFLLAFSRFACEVGFPKVLLIDAGSQLVNGCENMVLDMCNIKGVLNREYGIQFSPCPVGGHNFHGKVERKIKTVQETISKSVHNHRLSVLQWETLCSEIGNSINNLPLAIGNETENLENIDLITPNRLGLGRNNDRSPIGTLDVSDRIDRMLSLNSNIFNTWWETWLISAVPKIMPKPKWFRNDVHLKEGDVVLFNKAEGSIAGAYKFGIVETVHRSSDGHIRSVTIRYRNSSEASNRTTVRAVRSLVIIHRVDELNIAEELGKAALVPKL